MTLSAWKLLSLLLDHPDDVVLDGRGELLAAARELPADDPARAGLVAFCERFADPVDDAGTWQSRYVTTFDFSKRTALNLSYYTHGDRRQRGVALLKLKRIVAALELELVGEELPDYLPLILELADIAGDEVGDVLLSEYRPALELVAATLREGKSPYALLLDGLLARLGPLADADVDAVLRLAQDGPPTEEVGLEPFAPPEIMPALPSKPGRPSSLGEHRGPAVSTPASAAKGAIAS